jgi:hypothetical protein
MRKLASIQTIKNIQPIEGADRIEQATVLGWHVVVQKGLYNEGDRVIYLEIDSVLPKELAERAGFTDKYLKTRRFKGIYSQGMCIPISELYNTKFPYGNGSATDIAEAAKDGRWDGSDVTEYLGITKWEPDQRNDEQWWKRQQSMAKPPKKWYTRFRIGRWFWRKFIYKPTSGPFPTDLVPKTDETRVQVLGDILKLHKDILCQYTEKIDGSSITFWVDKKSKFHVCSRNREIFDEKDFMFETAAKLKDKLKQGWIYQGEILGPNIQGNKYGVKDYCIFVYQVYKPDEREYLNPNQLQEHLAAREIEQVPVLGTFMLTDNIDAIVDMSIGMSVLDKKYRTKETQREGIVIRPLINVDGICDKRFVGGRLSFKAVNPKFLIKYNL